MAQQIAQNDTISCSSKPRRALMLWLHVFVALGAFTAASAQPEQPIISWISSPLKLNETALVVGAFNVSGCSGPAFTAIITPFVQSRVCTSVNASAVTGHTTAASLKFIVPPFIDPACATGAAPGFRVQVQLSCSDGSFSLSVPYSLNVPEPWWVQGDAGDSATLGGWIRVLGLSIATVADTAASLRSQLRAVAHSMTAAAALTDDINNDGSELASLAQAILTLRSQLANVTTAAVSTLTLVSVTDGSTFTIPAAVANASTYSAEFAVPPSMPPDTYAVSISNGVSSAAVQLDSFVSADAPHVSTITIAPPAPWPAGVWTISTPTMPAQMPAPTSDADVQEALAAAAAAGGGTIMFTRGQFYLTQALILPPRTRLQGAGMSLTGLYFAEDTETSAPPAYIALNDALAMSSNSSAWGLSDLAIFVTGYHNLVIDVSNITNGFTMTRVRMRVNAFFGQNGMNIPTRGRWINISNWEVLGVAVQLNGRNLVVTDNDLYSDFDVISSQRMIGCSVTYWPNNCHMALYGYVARNVIYNGGAAHRMNQWSQMIFENNWIQGVNLMSMGQAAGTADGGFVHNMYIGNNHYQFVYGNDREVMTFDCAGGSYFGGVESVMGTTLITAADAWPAYSMNWGGWAGGSIVVVNSTGAGQWRRIVVPGVNDTAAPSNRTWIMDAPFTVPPLPNDSIIEIMPFRGRNIWHRNSYKDTGAVQFYGHAISNVVAEMYAERFGGLITWGEWRGWNPPTPSLGPSESDASNSNGACGIGNGIQPNVQNQWFDNAVLEGLTLMNYNCSATGDTRGSACGESWYLGHSFLTQGPYFILNASTPVPQHLANVYRGNSGASNSGFLVSSSTSNAIVERSSFTASDNCVTVQNYTDLIFVRGSNCT